MKRFDIVIADFLAHESDRVYHSNGEFVEAEVAQDLLEVAKTALLYANSKGNDLLANMAERAIAKAKGADHTQR